MVNKRFKQYDLVYGPLRRRERGAPSSFKYQLKLGVFHMTQLKVEFDGHSLITPSAIASELGAAKGEHFEDHLAIGKGELALLLELADQQFKHGEDPVKIIDRITFSLHEIRNRFHPRVWQELVPFVQNHPVSSFFLEDPLTRWSFEKPRGYSGDATLMDLIYQHESVADQVAKASTLGKALYEYTSVAPSSVAARDRRDILARHVDEVAAANGPETEVLSIAAGHLREAAQSVALREKALKRWVALDQDPLSVGTIARNFQGTAVEAIDGSVRSLLAGRQRPGQFDLVYASGLYDYLIDKVAIKLTQRCLEMLKPNGVFLFANFAYPITVDGYMETFMNWPLLLRSEADMWKIIHASTDGRDFESKVFFGKHKYIVYAALRKRA
jgi:SAM-dependent methyltransferase